MICIYIYLTSRHFRYLKPPNSLGPGRWCLGHHAPSSTFASPAEWNDRVTGDLRGGEAEAVADAAWENEGISMGFSVLLWGSWGYLYIYICVCIYICIYVYLIYERFLLVYLR